MFVTLALKSAIAIECPCKIAHMQECPELRAAVGHDWVQLLQRRAPTTNSLSWGEIHAAAGREEKDVYNWSLIAWRKKMNAINGLLNVTMDAALVENQNIHSLYSTNSNSNRLSPVWSSGLRHCISVQEASLQSLVQFQAVSHPAVIGSPIGWLTIDLPS